MIQIASVWLSTMPRNEVFLSRIWGDWIYLLRNPYEDAFSFNPLERLVTTLPRGRLLAFTYTKKQEGWCKNALERGITITIGPTSEPYLDAFPKPAGFFGLILSGHYSLVEAYYLSTRHMSWRMGLFDDPLYNPWKGNSLAKLQELQESIPEFRKLSALPIAPSDRSFPAPIQSAQSR